MQVINVGFCIQNNRKKTIEIVSGSNEASVVDFVKKEIDRRYKNLEFEDLPKLDKNSLVEEKQYYLNLADIHEGHSLYSFKSQISREKFLLDVEQIRLTDKLFEDFKKNKDRVSCLIVEADNEYLFLAISSRNTIKGKKFLGMQIGKKVNIAHIDYGIPIPSMITAAVRKSDLRLFVYRVIDFEMMIGINDAKREQAEQCLSGFEKGQLRVGQENFKVRFENITEIREKLSKRARNINRLSSYEAGQVSYSIEDIKVAIDKLQENKRLSFEEKEIIVTPTTFNTFTAILYDGIVQRVLSGEYDII